MNHLLPIAVWMGVGVPAALPFFLRRRWQLGLAVVPFAGCLALLGPWIVSALTGVTTAGAWWLLEAMLASILVGCVVELLARVLPDLPRSAQQVSAGAEAGGSAVKLVQFAEKDPPVFGFSACLGLAIMLSMAFLNVRAGVIFSSGAPPYGWDALAQWLLTVKVLADSPAFPREYFVPGGQWEYPLLMPALLACFRRFGQMGIHQLSFVIGLIGAVLPLATWLGSWRRIGPMWAALVSLVLFGVGRFSVFHYSCYADGILAMSGLAGMIFAVIGIRDRDKLSLIAGAVALAMSAATKNEGVVWTISCCLMLGIYALSRGEGIKRAVMFPLSAGLIGAIFFAGWWCVCRSLHLENDILAGGSLGRVSDRLGIVTAAFGRHLVTGEWRQQMNQFSPMLISWIRVTVPREKLATWTEADVRWAAFWLHSDMIIWLPAMIAMPFLARGTILRRILSILALLSAPLIYTLALMLVYLLTPKPLEWHMDNSLVRVLFIVPAAVLAAMTLIREPATTKTKNEQEQRGQAVRSRPTVPLR